MSAIAIPRPLAPAAAETLSFRAVIYRSGGRWIAQVLEVDLCTSATDTKTLRRRLLAQLRLHVLLAFKKERSPLDTAPKAPPKFWRMYLMGDQASPAHLAPAWWHRFLGIAVPAIRVELAMFVRAGKPVS